MINFINSRPGILASIILCALNTSLSLVGPLPAIFLAITLTVYLVPADNWKIKQLVFQQMIERPDTIFDRRYCTE